MILVTRLLPASVNIKKIIEHNRIFPYTYICTIKT